MIVTCKCGSKIKITVEHGDCDRPKKRTKPRPKGQSLISHVQLVLVSAEGPLSTMTIADRILFRTNAVVDEDKLRSVLKSMQDKGAIHEGPLDSWSAGKPSKRGAFES